MLMFRSSEEKSFLSTTLLEPAVHSPSAVSQLLLIYVQYVHMKYSWSIVYNYPVYYSLCTISCSKIKSFVEHVRIVQFSFKKEKLIYKTKSLIFVEYLLADNVKCSNKLVSVVLAYDFIIQT